MEDIILTKADLMDIIVISPVSLNPVILNSRIKGEQARTKISQWCSFISCTYPFYLFCYRHYYVCTTGSLRYQGGHSTWIQVFVQSLQRRR